MPYYPPAPSGGGSGDMTKAAYDAANVNEQLVGRTAIQTLTNKTLTSPVVNTPTGIVKGDVGLGNVDNTSNATERAAVATLTNKDLTSVTNTFPTLNQNTTGTASNVTGTVAVANGGTGATTLTGLVKGNGTSAMTAAVAGTDYLGFAGTAKITVATSAPGSPSTGDLWIDST